jgi:hypothetical protein
LIAVATAECDRPTAADRALLQADAEVFENVVRSESAITVADSAVPTGFLRVDSRPAGDSAILLATNQHSSGVELDELADSLSAKGDARIAEQRKEILKDLRVEEGGPFSYPGCGGIRPRRFRDSVATIGTECPSEWHRYVTIGLPYRGAAPVLTILRSKESAPPDSSEEAWTVLVTESSIGPGGQDLRQYAWLLRRNPETGHLVVGEKFLISWAE